MDSRFELVWGWDVVRMRLSPELSRLARLQDGVLTREQLLGHGWSNSAVSRAVRTGFWQRLASGVFFTAQIDVPWTAWAWAGVLIGGDAARIGGRAAAYLHKLIPNPPTDITVLVPATGNAPNVAGRWTFQRERPGARSPRSIGSPPRISVEDTVLDLCADPDPAVVVRWVTAAVQERLTNPERLRRALAGRRFVPQRALLEESLREVKAGVRSPLELAYVRDVERAHGLPTGRRQVRRAGTEADVLYDEYGLLVELDGLRGHDGVGRFRDMTRDNTATTHGLATLRYGQRDVFGRPCSVAVQVADVLTHRGWSGVLRRCRSCSRVVDPAHM